MSRITFVFTVLCLCAAVLLVTEGTCLAQAAEVGKAGLSADELKALAAKRKGEDKDVGETAKELLKKADKGIENKDALIIAILAKEKFGASDAAKAVMRFGSDEPKDVAAGLLQAGLAGEEVVQTMKYLKFNVKNITDGMLQAGADHGVVVSGLLKSKVPLAKVVGFLKRNKLAPTQMAQALHGGEVALSDVMATMKKVDPKLKETPAALKEVGVSPGEMALAMQEARIPLPVITRALKTIEIAPNIVVDLTAIGVEPGQIARELKGLGLDLPAVASALHGAQFEWPEIVKSLKKAGWKNPQKILDAISKLGFGGDLDQVASLLK